MSVINEVPSAERLHIGFFGKTNSGKSSLVNMLAGQNVSIVSDIAGTTTDVVAKSMEIMGLGACVLLDTAGFGDKTSLAHERAEKTKVAMRKADIAVIAVCANDICDIYRNALQPQEEFFLAKKFVGEKIPVIVAVTKCDCVSESGEKIVEMAEEIFSEKNNSASTTISSGDARDGNVFIANKIHFVATSAKNKAGIAELKNSLCRLVPENFGNKFILGNLVCEGDVVMLVMPQDKQAPKGRLILPQVQVIRELLDRKCVVISVTTEKLSVALSSLLSPPKIIITDSQVFKEVYSKKPDGVTLTSFSVLYAAYKGDLPYYVESAHAIDALAPSSRVLIAECCAHAPSTEDIGRVKIPRLLRERAGESLAVDIVSGSDFPSDLSRYDLIVQCGGCMFNRNHVISRIEAAKTAKVPMTNYGVAIAHLTGILDDVTSSLCV